MEALGLLIPTTTTAGGGSTASEAIAVDATAAPGIVDFASLLAAGMMPPLPPTGPSALAPSPHEGAQSAPLTLAEPAPDAEQRLLADPAQVLSHNGKPAQNPELSLPLHATQHLPPAASVHALHEVAPGSQTASIAASAAIAESAAAASAALAAASAARPRDSHPDGGDMIGHQAPDLFAPAAAPLIDPAAGRHASTAPIAVLEVAAGVDTPEFAPALSQQVVWMAGKDAQFAELRIHPPELGPVEVRLQLKGDEAAVQFVSAHAEVRNALEAALVRLRESLSEAGIQLGEASVGAESFRDRPQADGGRDGNAFGQQREIQGGWDASLPARRPQHGLVDLFA